MQQGYAKCKIMQNAELYKVQTYASYTIMLNYARFKILQSAKLCKVQNHEKCKSRHCAKLWKVYNCAKCKIMQIAKLLKLQNYAMCKIMQCAKLCKKQKYASRQIIQILKPRKLKNYAKWRIYKLRGYAKCESVLVWKWKSMHQPAAVTGNKRQSAPVSICSISASSSFYSLFLKKALLTVVRHHLTAPPSSTNVEGLFSYGGLVATDHRASLAAYNLDQTLFLRENALMANFDLGWLWICPFVYIFFNLITNKCWMLDSIASWQCIGK